MTAAAAGEVASARPDTDLHIAVLNGHREAFFDAGHAQQLVEQWNSVYAGTIDRDRAEGHPEAADRLTGRVESCAQEHWRRHGPGGMTAVWTRAPRFQTQHARSASFTGFARRRELHCSGPYVRSVWEFQSWFTTQAVRRRIEFRPRGVLEVEAYGVDQQAVETAFADAVARVLASPNTDDHLDPAGVLKVLRGLAEGGVRRYTAFEASVHTDVRAAIACGLVEEQDQLRLNAEGRAFAERHALAALPDPRRAAWEELPELTEAVTELGDRHAAAAQPA
ncbi:MULTISPECIES: hypothetical protein [Streptomyces]|uniref:Uncharacterized protein n=1 Tax=Streptomyces griseiscabiei TaxID=2993540 RepID=A0ABU4LKB1_9ACTN|nr:MULTISPECIES: hypothetical protein [Streptomyces]MBZ3908278.1 hypothetical protein [Streptomyces griseiscabiei]MDX2915690.1 hypothetical protein [Streptomyces griseiscabiei]